MMAQNEQTTEEHSTFHARAAVTGKARSPSVVRRVDGMMVASDNQARNYAHTETDRQTDAPAPNAGDLLSTYMSRHLTLLNRRDFFHHSLHDFYRPTLTIEDFF